MISQKTHSLLLANFKTPEQFLELVSTSPFSLLGIEHAFLEVQHYGTLEECVYTTQAHRGVSITEIAVMFATRRRGYGLEANP